MDGPFYVSVSGRKKHQLQFSLNSICHFRPNWREKAETASTDDATSKRSRPRTKISAGLPSWRGRRGKGGEKRTLVVLNGMIYGREGAHLSDSQQWNKRVGGANEDEDSEGPHPSTMKHETFPRSQKRDESRFIRGSIIWTIHMVIGYSRGRVKSETNRRLVHENKSKERWRLAWTIKNIRLTLSSMKMIIRQRLP